MPFFIPNVLRNFVLNFEMNNLSLSLMICSGMPWSANIFLKNNFVNFSAVVVVLHKTNFAYFVNPSIIVQIMS